MREAESAPKQGEVELSAGGVSLRGELTIPDPCRGLILFAHGSGSSRFSPRNRRVALGLVGSGFATLLLDLLTEDEERSERESGRYRFDVDLLSRRLLAATAWTAGQRSTAAIPIGYFGASTGAAAALVAAASAPERVLAVVSRGGRPDLAGAALRNVAAATLLIVGARDEHVLELNRLALAELRCEKRLVVVPGATHLFEEHGALDEVSHLAAGWFTDHLLPRGDPASTVEPLDVSVRGE